MRPAAIPKVKARTIVPVLLAQTMPYDGSGKLFTSSSARSRGWRLDLAAAPGWHEATACFVAEFSARRGGSVAGGRKVALRGGRTGRAQTEKRILVRMANAAIRHGAR